MKSMPHDAREELPCENVAGCVSENLDSLQSLLAIGIMKDGDLFATSTMPHTADILLLIDRLRQKLMAQFNGDMFR
jgi:hypothetical protein